MDTRAFARHLPKLDRLLRIYAGIPGWVITAITIACAAVCVGTVGLGCVGCIAAAAGVWGGQVGYCIDQAQK